MTDSVVLPPPAERGRLVIHDNVIEAIARKAAATVSDRCHATGLSRIMSNDLPSASVVVGPDHVVATLTVAARFPRPVVAVATRVQDAVVQQVHELTGLTVTRVDVEVRCVASDVDESHRKVL